MSHKPVSAAVHIKRKHQSAPTTHWADKEIQKAAEDLDSGRFVPDTEKLGALNALGLAVNVGVGEGVQTGRKPTFDEFGHTHNMKELAQHPRVMEVLEKLKLEIEESKDDQRTIEAGWAMHELMEEQAARNRWDGQGRWEGRENEEMRQGRILSPIDFHKELCKVVGNHRVMLTGHAVKTSPEAKSGRVALVIKNPRFKGAKPNLENPAFQAQKLRDSAAAHMDKVRQLRMMGKDFEANKEAKIAEEEAMAAGGLMMEAIAKKHDEEPELLRVATLQWPLGTEWMMMNFDEFGVPTTAKFLGWRTALLTMVRRRIISEEEAHKAFPIGTGPAAGWYLEQLQMFRNTGIGMVN